MATQWSSDRADAAELAESWAKQALTVLRNDLTEYRKEGRFCQYDFNSSSDYMLQGAAFIEPADGPDVRAAKSALQHHSEYLGALRSLSPVNFEGLSAGILQLMGVEAPTTTRRSGDQGIDFYGELQFPSLPPASEPGIEAQLKIWMVGQAKHYRDARVSTFEIRELVGSVNLARGRAFGSSVDPLLDLTIRVCDPVFYLFFTTGEISQHSWRLIRRSGVVALTVRCSQRSWQDTM